MLLRVDGSKCEAQEEIKGMVHGFYKNFFSAETCVSSDAVLDAIPSKVIAEMNEDLCMPYTKRKSELLYSKWG
jgi:hypothetical protein